MNQLFNKMRELSIRDLKERREEIFQRTRKMMEMGENNSQEEESYQQTQSAINMQEPIEEQLPWVSQKKANNNKARKKKDMNHRIRRYWRKLLQVNDWMLEIPHNLKEFYVAARPDGNKCLAIFKDYQMELRDKSGYLITSFQTKLKVYDSTILQAYFNQEQKILILSDLIVWKNNPMTSSQFQFRYSWLISNLNRANLEAWTKIQVFVIKYLPCNWQGLKEAYQSQLAYKKQGLLFIHKDSFYLHGLNPNVLIWKDFNISKYLVTEIEQNKLGSKGIGFLNKNGEVKTIENVTLFSVDRKTIDVNHRFVHFSYTDMHIENLENDQVKVYMKQLKIANTVKNHNGPIDSLGKLLYKCKIGSQMVKIQEIAQSCRDVQMMNSQ